MLRRLTILAIGVWLAASVPRAIAQDGRSYSPSPLFMPAIDHGAVPEAPPTTITGGSLPLAVPPLTSTSLPPAPTAPAVSGMTVPQGMGYGPTISSQINSPSASTGMGMGYGPGVSSQINSPSSSTTSGMGYGPGVSSPFSPPTVPTVSSPAMLTSTFPAPPGTTPTIPTSPGLLTDPRLNWSLGDYGPNTPLVAEDLNPPGQRLGWYADFDIGILKPHLDTHLSTPAGINGPTGAPITLGAASLDWTGVPEFSVGYRFGQGSGELRLSYRLIDSSGTETLPSSDLLGNGAQLHTSLNVQTLNLDYISPEYLSEGKDISRWFFRDLRAGVGLQAAAAYFDTRASGFPLTDTHISSAFGGIGPRMFVELHQDLGRPDFQFYTRVSGSGLLGPILQEFDQTSMAGGVSNFAGYDTHNKNIGMAIFQFESGLSWEPEVFNRRFRFTAAYSWERWWNFGRTDSSDAELTLQGAVLRMEFRY